MRGALALTLAMVAMPAADAAADAVARLAPSPHAACDLAALAPTVSGLVGRDVFVEDAPLVIRIAVAAQGDRRAARVELVERERVTGVRTLEAATCDELVAAMSVVLSLALRDREIAVDEPAPQAVERTAVVATIAPPQINQLDASISAAGGAAGDAWDLALVPGVRVSRGARSLGLDVELRAPDEVAAGAGRVRVSTIAITLVPCLRRRSIAGCGVVSTGWTRAAGEGLFDERVVRIPLFAAGARAEWEPFAFGRFAGQARAEVRANVHAAEFLVDQMPVWTSRRIEGWLGIGVVARIP